ncbi:hypothetical protein D9C73_022567 [Collichthys lucidus]|uniref:Uncharacterized protein n=1 Tax=Collichthys lucidus TaxID=240159 RepID=A0A4V6XZ12_COLLU|nr:hypothetical protein D9C73_022567 [Collichthys lucidus]
MTLEPIQHKCSKTLERRIRNRPNRLLSLADGDRHWFQLRRRNAQAKGLQIIFGYELRLAYAHRAACCTLRLNVHMNLSRFFNMTNVVSPKPEKEGVTVALDSTVFSETPSTTLIGSISVPIVRHTCLVLLPNVVGLQHHGAKATLRHTTDRESDPEVNQSEVESGETLIKAANGCNQPLMHVERSDDLLLVKSNNIDYEGSSNRVQVVHDAYHNFTSTLRHDRWHQVSSQSIKGSQQEQRETNC